MKKEEVPPAQPPAQPAAPVQQPVAEPEIPQLQAAVQEDIDLMNDFRRLPEAAQNRIYLRIGQERAWIMRWGDNLAYGRAEVQRNPQVLLRYIVRPNQ